MQGESGQLDNPSFGACRNFDGLPEAMAYDLNNSTSNDVTLQCGDYGDYA
jgi:hypothetical protein